MTGSKLLRFAPALLPLLLAAATLSFFLAFGSQTESDRVWAVVGAVFLAAALALAISLRRYARAKRKDAEEAYLRMVSGPAKEKERPRKGKMPDETDGEHL